jgi:cytochrome c553
MCSVCHGKDGRGVSPQFPNLAAQLPEYLVKQLKAFKADASSKPKRFSAVMTPIVTALSEADFVDIAAYYWKLEPAAGSARDSTRLDLGQRIYTEGNPAEGLPACITCHRATGSGSRPDFPKLSGQSAEYLDSQLASWMAVRGKPGKLMTMIVPHLQPEERQAVADYISQLH